MIIKNAISLISAKLTGKNVPLIVGWALTNKCNKKCSYCGLWQKNGSELSTKESIRIIDELSLMGTQVISFTGGEPLTRSDIGEIIDYAVLKGINVKLNSNGSLVKDKINEIRNISLLNLSLDGPEIIHDSIRGEGSYKDVVEAAKSARENGIKIMFSAVLSNKNYNCAEFVAAKAKEFSAKVSFQPATESLLGSKNDNPQALGYESYKEAVSNILKVKKSCGNISNTVSGLKHLLTGTKHVECAGGRITCRIEPNGDVLHCSRNAGVKSLNAVEHGFKAAFENLKSIKCANCLCASRLELNLLWSLNLKTIFERFFSNRLSIVKNLNNKAKNFYTLGITDTHGSGAAIIKNGKIIFAIEEERLNRIKSWRGMPILSIRKCFECTGIKPEDIGLITIAGKNTPNIFLRNRTVLEKIMQHKKKVFKPDSIIRKIYKNSQVFVRNIPFGHLITEIISRYLVKRQLRVIFKRKMPEIKFYEHHYVHAAAYYLSGFNKALTITMDNQGDGISSGVFKCEADKIELVHYENSINSLGYFYDLITAYLGFNPVSDAGKTLGLAAYGKPQCYELMKNLLFFKNGKIHCKVGLGFWAEDVNSFYKLLNNYKKEDVASSVQSLSEDIICKYVSYYVEKTGLKNVVFSGGVGYNIKVNQKIRALGCVDNFFAFPVCGDNGLGALCAVLESKKCSKIDNVYLGPSYDSVKVKSVLENFKDTVNFEEVDNIDNLAADLISKGQIVWRFQGRMEFGPRALGHRSILCLPNNADVCKLINKKLQREYFMPFCPSVLAEYSQDVLKGVKTSDEAPFMIMGYNVNEGIKQQMPAVVHVDNTARPQIVEKAADLRYWNVLNEVYRKTGFPVVLNTSFNMHGEPIVCSPEDAVKSFIASDGEFLALENYIVCLKSSKVNLKQEVLYESTVN